MLKRTKGRLLLSLLVITGMAGTLNTTALTKQERKFAVSTFKETRTNLQNSVKGLSENQLNFKPSADRWSIKECVFHIALAEQGLWEMLYASMKDPATPDKRSEITVSDADIMKMVTNRSQKASAPEPFQPSKATWKTVDEALTAFKATKAEHTRYIKTTTEDFRNRISKLPFATIDNYQFALFISGHTTRHTAQINELKNDPGFPKQ